MFSVRITFLHAADFWNKYSIISASLKARRFSVCNSARYYVLRVVGTRPCPIPPSFFLPLVLYYYWVRRYRTPTCWEHSDANRLQHWHDNSRPRNIPQSPSNTTTATATVFALDEPDLSSCHTSIWSNPSPIGVKLTTITWYLAFNHIQVIEPLVPMPIMIPNLLVS